MSDRENLERLITFPRLHQEWAREVEKTKVTQNVCVGILQSMAEGGKQYTLYEKL